MNQGVLEQARDAWILEYGKFIVSLLPMFPHQRQPVPINKAVGSQRIQVKAKVERLRFLCELEIQMIPVG